MISMRRSTSLAQGEGASFFSIRVRSSPTCPQQKSCTPPTRTSRPTSAPSTATPHLVPSPWSPVPSHDLPLRPRLRDRPPHLRASLAHAFRDADRNWNCPAARHPPHPP